jgi:hypothetical protein
MNQYAADIVDSPVPSIPSDPRRWHQTWHQHRSHALGQPRKAASTTRTSSTANSVVASQAAVASTKHWATNLDVNGRAAPDYATNVRFGGSGPHREQAARKMCRDQSRQDSCSPAPCCRRSHVPRHLRRRSLSWYRCVSTALLPMRTDHLDAFRPELLGTDSIARGITSHLLLPANLSRLTEAPGSGQWPETRER